MPRSGTGAYEPCRICGGSVFLEPKTVESSLGHAGADVVEIRTCSNDQCPSNTGERSLGDIV